MQDSPGAEPQQKRPKTMPLAEERLAPAEEPPLQAAEECTEELREAVLLCEDLMKLVFAHLSLEELCRAGMVRSRWHEMTNDPSFWRVINLEGKTLPISKVCRLLRKHSGVHELRARKVRFVPGDLPDVLPSLTSLRSLELEKTCYDERELEAMSRLPQLTRLLLAGGFVGSSNTMAMHAWANPPPQAQEVLSLSHSGLRELVLESGRTGRLAICTPSLVSLEIRDFTWGSMQLQGATSLTSLSVLDCGKQPDSSLRNLLCLEGQQPVQLRSLRHIHISNATHLSDETLRLAGQRHPSVTSLHVESCAAITGANLVSNGVSFTSLRHLWLEGCDLLNGGHLASSVQGMPCLESLSIMFCPQLSSLSLQCSQLTRLRLQGNRALCELSLRCVRLAHVELSPPAPGCAASHVLRRISLASYAAESLQWAAFPALEEVKLQCANLLELDLSECGKLKDSVFESLGQGQGVGGFVGPDGISPGCPRLRVLKLTDCDSLRSAVLSSPSLEMLLLSHCEKLGRVSLCCPALQRLGLEECTLLERLELASERMATMSLGTCPRLEAITIKSPSMDSLDLRGCNGLQRLHMDCPSLRKIDATFCGSLPNEAMEAVARCPALEDLTLAVCNSVTAEGLAALSALRALRCLDLSYMPIEDPRPIYAACRHLTSLTISNNYLLNPQHLLPLVGGGSEGQEGGGAGGGGSGGLLEKLVALDVSYCAVPPEVLEDLIVRGGRQLQQLTISGCSGVNDDLLRRLHRRQLAAAVAAAGGEEGRSLECIVERTEGVHVAQVQAEAQVEAHALRVLSLVGSKALRHVHLGLMPAELAAAQGSVGVPRAQQAQQQQLLQQSAALLALAPPPAGPDVCDSIELAPPPVEYVGVEALLPALEELRIGLTGVRTVAIGLPSLTRLQLFNCSELRQLELDAPCLEILSVQACKQLPLEALVAVLRSGCPRLKELDVQNYGGADGSTLVPLLKHACPTLQHVYVTTPKLCCWLGRV